MVITGRVHSVKRMRRHERRLCGLTFELSGRPTVGRQAWATENGQLHPVAQAWWRAVGPPLERRVRLRATPDNPSG
jgi:hypothetical protein